MYRVYESKLKFNTFPGQNFLRQRDALCPLLFRFHSEYAFREDRENQQGMKLIGTCQLLVYAKCSYINLIGKKH
jgi:hypothetical protein